MAGSIRRPGDPISPQVVKELRAKAGLTQEAFAQALGVRGGKSVISGWETGSTACDGPVAELIRLKYGGVSASAEELSASMANRWNAGPSPLKVWRQVSAVPRVPIKIEASTFMSLFPSAAIEPEKFNHGFPFVEVGSHLVFAPTSDGWLGRVPNIPEKSAHYLWMARRDGSFAYREPVWEDQQISGGHLHIRAVMVLACATVAFVPKIAELARLNDSVEYDLALEFEGMRGRGLVAPRGGIPVAYGASTEPERMWGDESLRVETSVTIAEMKQDLVEVSLSLVSELAFLLSPSLNKQALLRHLRDFHDDDKKRLGFRNFGVLDGIM